MVSNLVYGGLFEFFSTSLAVCKNTGRAIWFMVVVNVSKSGSIIERDDRKLVNRPFYLNKKFQF